MKAVIFREQNTIAAKDQPKFKAIPCFVGKVPGGEHTECVVCYELSDSEIMKLRATGQVWLRLLTYGSMITPHIVTVDNPFEEKP